MRTLALLCALAAWAAAQSPADAQPALAGRTVDRKGQPVRKVDLVLRPLGVNAAGESLAPYGVTSDTEGKFEFYGVPPGRYRLTGERAGYLETSYGARNTWAPGAVLTLGTGAPLTGVTVRMVEQAVLSGKVVTDEKANFWLIEVYEQQYKNGQRKWVCVDAQGTQPDGTFSFNKLKAGRYRLVIAGATSFLATASEDFKDYATVTYYPGVTDAASAGIIELRAGQTISDISLPQMRAPASMGKLSGSITGKAASSQRPTVYAAAAGSDFAGDVYVINGRFERERALPGTYIVGVVMGQAISDRRLAGHQIVQVSGDVEAPAFDLDAIGLRGTVQFDRGAPAGTKLRVKLMPIDDPTPYYAQAEVAADGTFAITGSFAGQYRIEIEGLPAGAYVKSALYGKKDGLGLLDLAFKSDEKLAIVIGVAGARVSGAVRDENGKALDGTVILVPDPPQPQKTSLYRLAETGENGRFLFEGVPPGKYRLYACEEFEPGAQFDPEVTAPLESRSVAIEVTEGERKEVTLPRIAAEEAAR